MRSASSDGRCYRAHGHKHIRCKALKSQHVNGLCPDGSGRAFTSYRQQTDRAAISINQEQVALLEALLTVAARGGNIGALARNPVFPQTMRLIVRTRMRVQKREAVADVVTTHETEHEMLGAGVREAV